MSTGVRVAMSRGTGMSLGAHMAPCLGTAGFTAPGHTHAHVPRGTSVPGPTALGTHVPMSPGVHMSLGTPPPPAPTHPRAHTHPCPHPRSLTDVGGDDGEGAEVGLAHVLCQGAGVVLEVLQQPGRAALRLLDQLPVPLVAGVQQGAAHPQQVLGDGQGWDSASWCPRPWCPSPQHLDMGFPSPSALLRCKLCGGGPGTARLAVPPIPS